MGVGGHEIDHLEGARNQDVVGVGIGHDIQQARFPVGRVDAELDGVDLEIVFVSDGVHAALGAIEEGLVAQHAVDHRDNLERLVLGKRRESEHKHQQSRKQQT